MTVLRIVFFPGRVQLSDEIADGLRVDLVDRRVAELGENRPNATGYDWGVPG